MSMPIAHDASLPVPPRIGLVGVGGYGSRHLHALQDLQDKHLVRLVAVADPYQERYPLLQQKLERVHLGWYRGIEEMLEGEELDAIVIAAPIPQHFAMTKLALAKGLHVYLEKPPVPLIQQIRELMAADQQQRVVVGFQLVQSPMIQRLKTAIIDGELGLLQSISASATAPRRASYYDRAPWAGRMLLGGEPVFDGPMTNALAHLLQNVLYLGGPSPRGFAIPEQVEAELYRALSIESYDVACLRGHLSSGVKLSFTAAHATEEILPQTVIVKGANGTARIVGDRLEINGECDAGLPAEVDLLEASHRQFLARMRGEDAFVVRLEDTLGYVLTTNAALVSSGGIHSIPANQIHRYQKDGDMGANVAGLSALMKEACVRGTIFSELGVSWATSPTPVRLDSLHALSLAEWTPSKETETPVLLEA